MASRSSYRRASQPASSTRSASHSRKQSASASSRWFSSSHRGATNREVAEWLFVSEATVKTHLLHIYARLGVNDRAAAVGAAFEKGLLTHGEGR